MPAQPARRFSQQPGASPFINPNLKPPSPLFRREHRAGPEERDEAEKARILLVTPKDFSAEREENFAAGAKLFCFPTE